MRILFDQRTPVPLRAHLKGHEVRTLAQEGWDKLRNGGLLIAADDRQEHGISAESARRSISIVVLGQQQWPPFVPSRRGSGQQLIQQFLAASPE